MGPFPFMLEFMEKGSAQFPLGIRFESIGGWGAHLAAQLLAESLVLRQGWNAAQFSSYGSEKKGSPVRSFIRVDRADQPIRVTGPVDQPDVLVVFHERLLERPATLAGWHEGTVVVVNALADSDMTARLPRGPAWVVEASAIADQEKTRLNTAILGTVARACPWMNAEELAETLRAAFAGKSAKLAEANVRTFWRGHREARSIEGTMSASQPAAVPQRWGYLTQPMGGVVLEPGNTMGNDLSLSRQGWAPRWRAEQCTHCGLCDLVCPDYCFSWVTEEVQGVERVRLKGIDYRYCKGCLRCIETCPSEALTKEREGDWVKRERVPVAGSPV